MRKENRSGRLQKPKSFKVCAAYAPIYNGFNNKSETRHYVIITFVQFSSKPYSQRAIVMQQFGGFEAAQKG